MARSFASGAFISGSNEIIAAGGDTAGQFPGQRGDINPLYPRANADAYALYPTPTASPTPACGLLIGDGLTIGFEPNGYQLIASNIVDYTFA